MHKKFFLISQVFYPDEVSTAGLFTDLCSRLTDDLNVVVWCAHPAYSVRKRMPRQINYNGISIHYIPSTNFPKDSFPGKLINMLTFTISVFTKLLFTSDKSIVFTHTTPPVLGIVISLTCSIKKRKVVNILLDILPEGLVRLGTFSRRNIFVKFWQKMFVLSLKKSCRIIVIGRDMRNWVGVINLKLLKKTEYLPLWKDENIIFEDDFNKNEFIINNGLHEKFIIQYSGNMGLWNDMETIGEVVNVVDENFAFMFVGGGVRKKELLNSIIGSNLKKAVFLPFQPKEKLGSLLTACHVSLISMKNGLEGMAVPSKIYGILASGKAIIAMVPVDSEIASIVREENCGMIVNPGNMKDLLDSIFYLKSHEKLRLEMGRNGRNAFEKKYSTRIMAEKYNTLITSIT